MPSPLLLLIAAVAVTPALLADLAAAEHPAHSVVLGLAITAFLAARRRMGCTAATAVPSITAALAIQPVLHLVAGTAGVAPSVHDDHGALLHIVQSEAPTAVIQVLVPVVVLGAVTIVAHLLCLTVDAVRRPLTVLSAPAPLSHRVLVPFQPRRLGSMLSWCGWAIRSARRGPPRTSPHIVHQAVLAA